MATDKILVERQTQDAPNQGWCGIQCPQLGMDGLGAVCRWQGKIIRLNEIGDFPLRCPACLATPPARELTPEMELQVRCAVQALEEAHHDYQRRAAADSLRAAFGIEEGSGDSWRCGICGAVRSDVEPVQDAECGDSCPEHFKEEG